VYGVFTDAYREAVHVAVQMMEALRSLHATPDTEADVEAHLAAVARQALTGNEADELLRLIKDVSAFGASECQEHVLAGVLYAAADRARITR
jgi:hypothetical protein